MANIVNQYGQVKVGVRIQSGGGGGGIDTDAQAFITAASITDSTQQSAINTLVTQLKTYGIWTKLKAVYPFVGGSASSHKFNLKDPRDLDAAYRLVFNGGWTHSSTGALPNGTNAYAETKLIPSSSLTVNSTHLSFYSRTSNVKNGARDIAVYQNQNLPALALGTNTGILLSDQYNYTTLRISVSLTNALGFFIGSRSSSTSHKLYGNGTQLGLTNTTPNALTLPNQELFISAENNGPYPVVSFSDKQSAFASIGDGLTDTEAANFYTAVQTFQTTLGRQVGVPIVADADAQAFLNAAVITDQTQASAINTLVTDLKSANIWTKMKALYPFVGGSASSHKFNLKDPRDLDAAFRLQFNGGWTHNSNGVLPNGTTGYANTYFNPITASQSLSSTHLSVYTTSTNSAGTSRGYIGSMETDSTNYTALGWFNGGTYEVGVIGSNSFGYTGNISAFAGFKLTSTNGDRVNRYFKNSSKQQSISQTQNFFNANMYLGAINYIGNPAYYQNVPFTFSSIGDGLTDAEAAAFYTAVQKYQTTLGRQV